MEIVTIALAAFAAALCIRTAVRAAQALKRLREDMDSRAANLAGQVIALRKDVSELLEFKEDLQKENGEGLRRDVLLRELNDELEKTLKVEKEWNAGIAGILDYSVKTALEGMKNE